MRATLRRYHEAIRRRMANLEASPLPLAQKPSARYRDLTPSSAFSQKPNAFWSSNSGGGRWRLSKDCSSSTPAMSAKARIEEGCSIGGWHTICYPGSRQSSRRCSQISRESTKELRPRLQRRYLGHFGAFIASKGKLQWIC
jgi:hypothetical protein